MKIKEIIVDELPKSCSECSLFVYNNYDRSICAGLNLDTEYLDSFCRSDCPLKVYDKKEYIPYDVLNKICDVLNSDTEFMGRILRDENTTAKDIRTDYNTNGIITFGGK